MHMPGHNFTGPGTKLNKRLNEDMTPKAWSKPINRVDKAAYHHDICYVRNKDTKTRNEICDKNMLQSLMVFITLHFKKGWREVLFLRLSGRKNASDGG